MITMEYYDYLEWIEWPEADIREYAQEIAIEHDLNAEQAEYIERRMTMQAGYAPQLKGLYGPDKMDTELEALFRSLGNGTEEVLKQNRRLNTPFRPTKYEVEIRNKTVGKGLSRKFYTEVIGEEAYQKRKNQKALRDRGKHPFTTMNPTIQFWAEQARWAANCYPVGNGVWIVWPGSSEPYAGLFWYADALEAAYYNARSQSDLGNTEAAMWHAFRAGRLQQEIDILLAHGTTFDKYASVRQAQRDAATSRKTVTDEARRDAYWRHRKEGNKRVESGRLAGQELGLSEASIRNAFPEAKYPVD